MPDSNPKAFARRLREAVENREPLDAPELRAEAAADPACEALWRRQCLVETAVEAIHSEDPPEVDLADRVLAALAEPATNEPVEVPVVRPAVEPVVDRPVGRARSSWLLVVAAAVILVAVLAIVGPGRRPDAGDDGPIADGHSDRSPEVVETPRDREVREAIEPNGDELDRLVAEATTAYRGFAEGTRVAVADLGFLIPRTSDDVPPTPAPMEEPNWLDRVGGGLAPVRDNVGRTLDFLLEPVPADSTNT